MIKASLSSPDVGGWPGFTAVPSVTVVSETSSSAPFSLKISSATIP